MPLHAIEQQIDQMLDAREPEERRELAIEQLADDLESEWRADPATLAEILDEWRGESDANETKYQQALDACLYPAPAGDSAGSMRHALGLALESAAMAAATQQIDKEDQESRIEAALTRRELRSI